MNKEIIGKLLLSSNLDDVKIGVTFLTELEDPEIIEILGNIGELKESVRSNGYYAKIVSPKFPERYHLFECNNKLLFYGETQIHYCKESFGWPVIKLD